MMADYDRRKVAASRLASMAASRAKAKWGPAYSNLGKDLRQAVISAEYVAIIAGQEAMEPGSQAERIIDGAMDVVSMK